MYPSQREKRKGRLWLKLLIAALALILIGLLCITAILLALPHIWGYAREVSPQEEALRQQVVDTAVAWYGCREDNGTHKPIIDIYNSHPPLARGYAVKYTDDWCSTFASTVAIQCGLTDIIPTECGCERHIELFMALDSWVEADDYVPLPGDYIFYHWNCESQEDCTHWSDHIGIVVGTFDNWIKVVEGNRYDDVSYTYLQVGDPDIRGYGTPNYSQYPEN